MDISNQLTMRLTDYDKSILAQISADNPHVPDVAGLVRLAFRAWQTSPKFESLEKEILELKILLQAK